jgi:hypothetical protein
VIFNRKPSCRQWCVGRSTRMTERADENDRRSDGRRKLVEGCAEQVAGGDVGGEFVVAAAEILHEGVIGGQDPPGRALAALRCGPRVGWLASCHAGRRAGAGIRRPAQACPAEAHAGKWAWGLT